MILRQRCLLALAFLLVVRSVKSAVVRDYADIESVRALGTQDFGGERGDLRRK